MSPEFDETILPPKQKRTFDPFGILKIYKYRTLFEIKGFIPTSLLALFDPFVYSQGPPQELQIRS